MAVPELGNYEYQFVDDASVLLNGPDTSLPFWDVTSVTGLDTPPIEPNTQDKDSGHGAYVYAKSTGARTIIISGTMYADTSLVEQAHDAATEAFFPDDINKPLYFKHPGVDQRYILCKALGYKSDISTARRTGTGEFQVQLIAEDTRKYVDNADETAQLDSTAIVTNDGFASSHPFFVVTNAASSFTLENIENITWNELLDLDGLVVNAGQDLLVDTQRRKVTVDGVDMTKFRGPGSKWPMLHKGANTFVVRVVGSESVNYTVQSKSAWW